MRQLVYVGLARKVIGGRRQTAIGTLAQRRLGGVKFDMLVWDGVQRADGGRAGVVVVELPGGDLPILPNAARDLDDAPRTKIGPGELLFPRPNDLDGLPGG